MLRNGVNFIITSYCFAYLVKKIMEKINSFFNTLSKYSGFILRVGISFVFIWFGLDSIIATEKWISLVPEWAKMFGSPEVLVLAHGIVEFVFGIFLAFNLWRRISASILFLSLFNTLFLVSGPILVRDIGLAVATLSIALYKEE